MMRKFEDFVGSRIPFRLTQILLESTEDTILHTARTSNATVQYVVIVISTVVVFYIQHPGPEVL